MTFNLLNQSLERAGSTISASESQGLLFGLLCGQRQVSREDWLNNILLEVEDIEHASQNTKPLLNSLFDDVLKSLAQSETLPNLLIPEEATMLNRIDAVARWCQGFLYGFGQTRSSLEKLSENSKEWLSDVTEIAQLSDDLDELEDENEADFLEVTEYLKVGLKLLHDERHLINSPPTLH